MSLRPITSFLFVIIKPVILLQTGSSQKCASPEQQRDKLAGHKNMHGTLSSPLKLKNVIFTSQREKGLTEVQGILLQI